jgi:hypothetical protein
MPGARQKEVTETLDETAEQPLHISLSAYSGDEFQQNSKSVSSLLVRRMP